MKLQSLIRPALVILVGLPLLAVSLLFATLYTETGSRLMVQRALELNAEMLSITEFRGRLLDAFELRNLHIDTDTISANIERVSVEWRPRSLLGGELTVAITEVDGIDIHLDGSTSATPNSAPISLPKPPLPLRLEQLILTRVTIHMPGRDVVVDRLELGAIWDTLKFAFSDFEMEAYGHKFGAGASIDVGDQPDVDANADWTGTLAGEGGTASVAISGPLSKLSFQSQIDAAISAEVTGSVSPFADAPSVSLRGMVQAPKFSEDITLAPTYLDVEGVFPSLEFSLSSVARSSQIGSYALSLDAEMLMSEDSNNGITAKIAWRAIPQNGEGKNIVGSGTVRYDGKNIHIDHATLAPFSTKISGDLGLRENDTSLDFNIAWNDVNYNLAEDYKISSRVGSINLKGSIDNLAVTLAGALDIPAVGPSLINGRGQFSKQQFSVEEIRAKLLGGKIRTHGKVLWADGVGGEFRFEGSDIDLSAIYAETPSRLVFSGTTTFRSDAHGLTSHLDIDDMSGYLRGQAVSGEAKIATTPGLIVFERTRLKAGNNAISLHGTWGSQMDGDFDLRLDDLSVFDARLNGKLIGSGTFSGQPQRPKINTELKATALKFEDNTAGSIAMNIDVDATSSTESNASFDINTLTLSGKQFGDLTLSARGTTNAHTVLLGFQGSELDVSAALSGALHNEDWRGSLDKMTAVSTRAGTWYLVEPTDVTYVESIASLNAACFEATAARGCVSARQRAEESIAHLELQALPLALLDPFLPVTLKIEGLLDGVADLKATKGVLTGNGQFKVSDGSIVRDRGTAKLDKVSINSFELDFDMEPDKVSARADANVEQWFTVQARLNAARATGGHMTGGINAQFLDLSWISEFVPALGGSEGELSLTSTIGGTFDAPQADMRARLLNGAIRVPEFGLEVNQVEANISGNPRSIDVDAVLGAGEGELKLTGAARQDKKNTWRYDLALDGSDFPAVRTPEIEVDVSPALRLAGDTEYMDVTGSVLVPRVFVDVKQLPKSAVKVSEDQVIVNADGDPVGAEMNGNIFTDKISGAVNVRLGDDISINGFGLTSRLSGGIDWKKKRGINLGTATGNVIIETGVFNAYGQNMEIQNGRIEFAGPIDNPNLNLRAVRPNLSVKAGVDVTGTVRNPKISLFSNPTMSDGNTLSYIVVGRGLDDAGAGDAALLTQAALSLGAEESAIVTNQIRDTFGLDELTIATGTTTRDTSLVAGKRLSPKLSVRTGFNPFDQLWSFFLNYKITERWSVEAESGERQGADLLYSIERENLMDALLPFELPSP